MRELDRLKRTNALTNLSMFHSEMFRVIRSQDQKLMVTRSERSFRVTEVSNPTGMNNPKLNANDHFVTGKEKRGKRTKTNDTCKKKFKEHIYKLIADGDADLHHDLG